MSLRLAYNTNGLAHHRLDDAIALVADCGYDGIALTLDHHHLDPFAADVGATTAALAHRLDALGLGVVIETGARFLLDPRAKHEPTLVSPSAEGRARRVDFLDRALAVGAELGAEAVSFWAGVPAAGLDPATAWGWLGEGVQQVTERAERRGVVAALEPEPGMVVDTADGWSKLVADTGATSLRLALDVGHCLVTGDRDPAAAVRDLAPHLGTVSIEDMAVGVHEHLPFGTGDLDAPAVVRSLVDIGWSGLTCVELSRDSHRAHEIVPATIAFLRAVESAP